MFFPTYTVLLRCHRRLHSLPSPVLQLCALLYLLTLGETDDQATLKNTVPQPPRYFNKVNCNTTLREGCKNRRHEEHGQEEELGGTMKWPEDENTRAEVDGEPVSTTSRRRGNEGMQPRSKIFESSPRFPSPKTCGNESPFTVELCGLEHTQQVSWDEAEVIPGKRTNERRRMTPMNPHNHGRRANGRLVEREASDDEDTTREWKVL
ncbi:hypothetical protein EV361DRAFT_950477 [Lentinula raphanica]|uniref:Uncharacterized protein n=1 Tax=Lentinula raphanica TaxID=153919 RepID=A0AA38PC20_9AGAR|nr:hypothetical protein F5878DRAFT_659668 [Lentinula raphanica]KAJ3970542.1 hypothetical protein EV361DRAFT_950477 [Lentinula raphanica]